MLTVIIKYHGQNGKAKKFMEEMLSTGLVDKIRQEEGNLGYNYYLPIDDKETILLIDSWLNQEALDKHHQLALMKEIASLREKYNLHMEVVKYQEIKDEKDLKYIRK